MFTDVRKPVILKLSMAYVRSPFTYLLFADPLKKASSCFGGIGRSYTQEIYKAKFSNFGGSSLAIDYSRVDVTRVDSLKSLVVFVMRNFRVLVAHGKGWFRTLVAASNV